jgi:integrase/recombinase XerC
MNLDAFTHYLRDDDLAERTITKYARELQRFAAWFEQTTGRPLAPAELSTTAVKDYRQHLQTVQHLQPATVNHRLMAVRAYGAWAVAAGEIPTNPAAAAKLIGAVATAPKGLEPKHLAALEREVERAVLNARTDSARFLAVRNQAIVKLLAGTGLRIGEMCDLDAGDVELSERKGWLTVRRGKGNKQRRVPLILDVRQALAAYHPLRVALAIFAPACGRLFVSEDGRALSPRGVQYLIAHLGQRAGVDVSPHALRHTFAHNLISAGERLETVADLLGHSKLDTTRRYTKATERDLERAVQRLED